jgi:DNA repair photolyase
MDLDNRPGAHSSIRLGSAKSILAKTSGFIAQAGFTHSLNPARNCTFGCIYCYVPTLRIQAGLRPEDWRSWGRFTTFKDNAAALLADALRPHQIIYCSPLVDPYQPAEGTRRLMPEVLQALIRRPPRVFVLQTRGGAIVRDVPLLRELAARTRLRVSFSLTTDREEIRKLYEPHCAPLDERLHAMETLREAGIDVFATLAPLLPCNPRLLARLALAATENDLIGDPLHARATKRRGATTRPEALEVSRIRGYTEWHEPGFQQQVVETIQEEAHAAGRRFGIGPEAFGWLAGEQARAGMSQT